LIFQRGSSILRNRSGSVGSLRSNKSVSFATSSSTSSSSDEHKYIPNESNENRIQQWSGESGPEEEFEGGYDEGTNSALKIYHSCFPYILGVSDYFQSYSPIAMKMEKKEKMRG
jgi:hypothetical protein